MLPTQSRCRRLQYDWLRSIAGFVQTPNRVVDLGGVRGVDYHAIMGLEPTRIDVWNADKKAQPHELVDLEKVDSLPAFPKDCDTVLAFNVLEHLFRPLDVIDWACRNLPSGGRLVILVPFLFGIHPTPRDYWRFTPHAFEDIFADIEARRGLKGALTIAALGEDYREGVAAFLGKRKPAFKGR